MTAPAGGVKIGSQVIPTARAILWNPLADGAPQRVPGGAYPVFVEQKALAALQEHFVAARGKPVFGFLTGDLYQCPTSKVRYAVVDSTIRLNQQIYGDRTDTVVGRLWDRVLAELAKLDAQMIGWYHSHPGSPFVLSPHDVATQESHFTSPWHVALLLGGEGPTAEGAFFRRSDAGGWPLTPIPFYELIDDAERLANGRKQAVLPWRNYATDDAGVVRGAAHPTGAARKSGPAARPGGPARASGPAAAAAAPTAPETSGRPVPPAPNPPRPPAAREQSGPRPAVPAAPPPASGPRPAAPEAPPERTGPRRAVRPGVAEEPPARPVFEPVEPPAPAAPAARGAAAPPPPPRPTPAPTAAPPPSRPSQPVAARRPSRPTRPSVGRLYLQETPRHSVVGRIVTVLVVLGILGGAGYWYLVLGAPGLPVHWPGQGMFGPARPATPEPAPAPATAPPRAAPESAAAAAAPPVTPAESAGARRAPAPSVPPAAPRPDPTVALDRAADSLSTALSNYDERAQLFASRQIDCSALQTGLAGVEHAWTRYLVTKRAVAALDAGRLARDRRLAPAVDGVEGQFGRSQCPRP